MATLNPLEQKARSSFIKGFILALFFGIIGVGAIGMLYFNLREQEQERLAAQQRVLVLQQDVVSGEIITGEMFVEKACDADKIPAGATVSYDTLSSYYAQDKNGNKIYTRPATNKDGTQVYIKVIQISVENKEYELKQDDNGTYYYVDGAKQTQYIELGETTLVAKIDLGANTVITPGMITLSDEQPTDDLRDEQYNMIVLPSNLMSDETIDVRLRLPSGQDYIVLSKKKVAVPEIGDGNSSSTVQLKVTEGEILTMSAAIVDAYKITGSKLYAIRYSEPGIQKKATATYIPAESTLRLISEDPNIVNEAKNKLIQFYNVYNDKYRSGVANALGQVEENTQQSNLESGTSSETQAQKSERQEYLQSLAQ